MNRYYVDWVLCSYGEFLIEAESTYEAERLVAEIIEGELLEICDATDADVSIELDDEPNVPDTHLHYYRASANGTAERFK